MTLYTSWKCFIKFPHGVVNPFRKSWGSLPMYNLRLPRKTSKSEAESSSTDTKFTASFVEKLSFLDAILK